MRDQKSQLLLRVSSLQRLCVSGLDQNVWVASTKITLLKSLSRNTREKIKAVAACTQRNLFEILLNQTEIWLYLPFSDWFGTKRTSVWFQINRIMVNTIRFRFDFENISLRGDEDHNFIQLQCRIIFNNVHCTHHDIHFYCYKECIFFIKEKINIITHYLITMQDLALIISAIQKIPFRRNICSNGGNKIKP